MPYTFKFDQAPAGICISPGVAGDLVKVATKDFTSSEDGDLFISRLEGFPSDLISRIPPEENIRASTVDHILAIIARDGTCTLYVNELNILGKARVTRRVEQGEALLEDDISDIQQIEFEGISIPRDAGFLVLLSMGWRKGLYFDLTPITQENYTREHDVNVTLGQIYNYLTNQFVFKIKESEWSTLHNTGWFPFIALRKATIRRLLSLIRSNLDPDDVVDQATKEVLEKEEIISQRWKQHPILAEHALLLLHALSRFREEDYISAVAIFYPRIEGILRTISIEVGQTKSSQSNLSSAPLEKATRAELSSSIILPEKFKDFLFNVYFASFDPSNPTNVSRHSVAHGVAPQDRFSKKSALIGILIVEQILHHIPNSAVAEEK